MIFLTSWGSRWKSDRTLMNWWRKICFCKNCKTEFIKKKKRARGDICENCPSDRLLGTFDCVVCNKSVPYGFKNRSKDICSVFCAEKFYRKKRLALLSCIRHFPHDLRKWLITRVFGEARFSIFYGIVEVYGVDFRKFREVFTKKEEVFYRADYSITWAIGIYSIHFGKNKFEIKTNFRSWRLSKIIYVESLETLLSAECYPIIKLFM